MRVLDCKLSLSSVITHNMGVTLGTCDVNHHEVEIGCYCVFNIRN